MSRDRCLGALLWRAWKAKQLKDRLTAEISRCRSCHFPLSALVLVGEKLHFEMTKQPVSSGTYFIVSYPCRYLKGNCMRSVTSDQNESHLLSVSVCYLFGQTHTHQHSHNRGGQTILNMASFFLKEVISDGGEVRSSSPDIKLSYPLVPSQMMPDNRNNPHGTV